MPLESVASRGSPVHSRAMTTTSRHDGVWRDRLLITLAYTLAWGLMLVNRGLYWDDWSLSGIGPAALVRTYVEVGLPWFGAVHAVLFSLPLPGLASHVITFVVYLLSSLLFHAILRRIPGLGRTDALVAALVFAVLPVNVARIAIIDLPYGLCLLAFLLGTYLLVRYLEVGGIVRRLLALLLFLFSFSTASLLVMYAVPIVLAGYLAWRAGRRPLPAFAFKSADFLVLPFAYWLVKSVALVPSGAYEGYNELTVKGLLAVPAALVPIPHQVLVEPLERALVVAGVLGLVVGVIVGVWLTRRARRPEPDHLAAGAVLLASGATLVAMGVVAYLAVGRVPTIWDWSSRHQLLVPIGAGLLAAAAVRVVRGAGRLGPIAGIAVGLLIGVSIVADARTLLAYQLDWFKQVAVVDAVRATPEVRTAMHIRIVDHAATLNAMRRAIRFYEYNALFEQATGDQRRLVATASQEPDLQRMDVFISHPSYHMTGYVPAPVDLELVLTSGHRRPGVPGVLGLVLLEAMGSPSFHAEVSRLIVVTAQLALAGS